MVILEQEKQFVYIILIIWNCFILLFKDFKLGIILRYNID